MNFCENAQIFSASFCDNQSGWKQVFKDDFNSIDNKTWTVNLGKSDGLARQAWLMAENVYTENGNLVIKSASQKVFGDGQWWDWTSGALTSQDKKFYQYGRFCISAKLPGAGSPGQGQGIWPAHWLMPNDNSCWPDHGEIDIMEMINGKNTLYGTYHWNQQFPTKSCIYTGTQLGGSLTISPNFGTQYAEYSVEWGQDYIIWQYNGEPYYNITANSGNPHPLFPPSAMYWLLNTAVGGPWPGPPGPNTMFPTYQYIDYVAVAQKA